MSASGCSANRWNFTWLKTRWQRPWRTWTGSSYVARNNCWPLLRSNTSPNKWRALEQAIVEKSRQYPDRIKLLCYVEASSFDGVDLQVEIESHVTQVPESDLAAHKDAPAAGYIDGPAAAAADPVEEAIVERRDKLAALAKAGESTVSGVQRSAKVLQSSGCAALGYAVDDRLYVLQNNKVLPLQCSDRATGERIFELLERQSARSDDVSAFPRKVRDTCTDRFRPNDIAEEAVISSRGDGWTSYMTHCEVHMAATGLSESMSIMHNDKESIKSWAKSLNGAGEFDKFRASYLSVLWSKLELVDPYELSPEAVSYKEQVLDVVGDEGARDAVYVGKVLCRCAPGDWRRRDRFEFFATPGTDKHSVFRIPLCRVRALGDRPGAAHSDKQMGGRRTHVRRPNPHGDTWAPPGWLRKVHG